jgi:hypothetical protein
MAGHVFIMHGDLTRVASDAWLMPCGIDGSPSAHWMEGLELPNDFVWPRPPLDWGAQDRRAFPFFSKRHRGSDGQWVPMPWLVHVGGGRRVPITWFVQGVREFLGRVAADLTGTPPAHNRVKHLVALPLVGTGFGGMRHRAGEMVRALLPVLYDGVTLYDLDVVLVIKDAPDYAAAQRERRLYQQAGVHRWPELDTSARRHADALAKRASAGQLVLFMGAGVSVGAGLPTWGEFLRLLAQHPLQQITVDVKQLERLSYGDQARIIERGFGGRELMGEAISQILRRRNYSLTHAMLAALPVVEAVTTNYDTLFEQACDALGQPVAVLPYESVGPERRWVLKMHGCVRSPADIVLTREDYLRYAERRSALGGIVQALLITKHMLFVGFSLDDDNFHRIADDVRKVARGARQDKDERFGTSIVLVDRPFLAQLWEREIDMVVLQQEDTERAPGAQLREAARHFEIFLDYLLAQVADPSYLLDDRFMELLTEEERDLRDMLLTLVGPDAGRLRGTPAWGQVERLLLRLGWRPPRRR